jgi:cytochrome c oxidase subunit 2
MLFNVKVVSRAEYDAHLKDLESQGFASQAPVIGGKYADTVVGGEADGADQGGAE